LWPRGAGWLPSSRWAPACGLAPGHEQAGWHAGVADGKPACQESAHPAA
jgi:hypothetical protein